MDRDIWFEVSKHVPQGCWLSFIRVCKLFNSFNSDFELARRDIRSHEFIKGRLPVTEVGDFRIVDYLISQGLVDTEKIKFINYFYNVSLHHILKYKGFIDKSSWFYLYRNNRIPYNKTMYLLKDIWDGPLYFLKPGCDFDKLSGDEKYQAIYYNKTIKDSAETTLVCYNTRKLRRIHVMDYPDDSPKHIISNAILTTEDIRRLGIQRWNWGILTKNRCIHMEDILANLSWPWYWPNLLKNPNIKPKDLRRFPNIATIIKRLTKEAANYIELVFEVGDEYIPFWDWTAITKIIVKRKHTWAIKAYPDLPWCKLSIK